MVDTANEDRHSILLNRMLRSTSTSEDIRIFSMLSVNADDSLSESKRTLVRLLSFFKSKEKHSNLCQRQRASASSEEQIVL